MTSAQSDPGLARYIQHTLIEPGVTAERMTGHCEQAAQYGFDAAMVPAIWVDLARSILAGTSVKVASALDFPFGCMTTEGKVAEAKAIAAAGADELDIGVHIGFLRSGRHDAYRDDIAAVAAAVDIPVKVMLELPLLTADEKERAVELAVVAGAAVLKNASSGAVGVATPEDITFLRERAPAAVRVKASGGISSAAQVRVLLAAGADLAGSSAGLAIIGVRPGDGTGSY
jgi:deoxyribose-phosphate aldolase